jgi:hypothetical protein
VLAVNGQAFRNLWCGHLLRLQGGGVPLG